MSENKLFKKSFWLGRLIWINGEKGSNKNQRLGNLLLECGVLPSEVLRVDPLQFVDLCARGISREIISQYEVVVVSGFEDLSGGEVISFLKGIQSFCDLQVGLSLQLILISSNNVSAELKRFEQFNPIEITVDAESEDPGEMNERLHDLLSLAMKITGVAVNRISERAAVFLENFLHEEGDYDALVLISMGLGRSNKRELRLRDLVPTPRPKPALNRSAEMPCF